MSLVQLGRTAGAAPRHADAGLLSIAVHRSPTTGGVLASYGSLCDLRAVEAGAVIGFAGPRVVAETTGEVVGDALAQRRDRAAPRTGRRGPAPGRDRRMGRRRPRPPRRAAGARAPARPGRSSDDDATCRPGVRCCGPAGPTDRRASTWPPRSPRHGPSWAATDPTVRAGLATIDGRRVVVIANDRHTGSGRPGADGFRLARRAVGLADRLGHAARHAGRHARRRSVERVGERRHRPGDRRPLRRDRRRCAARACRCAWARAAAAVPSRWRGATGCWCSATRCSR